MHAYPKCCNICIHPDPTPYDFGARLRRARRMILGLGYVGLRLLVGLGPDTGDNGILLILVVYTWY